MGVGRLSSQRGGVRRPRGRLLSGGGFGHLVGQTGAAGAGHGRRATGGTEKITRGQETRLASFSHRKSSFKLLKPFLICYFLTGGASPSSNPVVKTKYVVMSPLIYSMLLQRWLG